VPALHGPELDDNAERLWRYATEAGLCESNGMGLQRISWFEINQWAMATGIPLDPQTALAIRAVSEAYVSQAGDKSPATTAPWGHDEKEEKSVGSQFKEAFDEMGWKVIRKKPKRLQGKRDG